MQKREPSIVLKLKCKEVDKLIGSSDLWAQCSVPAVEWTQSVKVKDNPLLMSWNVAGPARGQGLRNFKPFSAKLGAAAF